MEQNAALWPLSIHAITGLRSKPLTTLLLVQHSLTCVVFGTNSALYASLLQEPRDLSCCLFYARGKLPPKADGHSCSPGDARIQTQQGFGGDANLLFGQLVPWEIQKQFLKQNPVFRLKAETRRRDDFGCFFQHCDVSKSLSSSLNNCLLASMHSD